MSIHWENKLNLGKEFELWESGDITTQDVCKAVVEKLERMYRNPEYELEMIIEEFKYGIGYEDFDENDFNYLLSDLYDWGDIRKRLWIQTF